MALGKNFNDILGDYFGDEAVNLNEAPESLSKHGFSMIPVDDLQISPFQTRVRFDDDKIESLAKSIEKSGLLSPVIVLEKDTKGENGLAKAYVLLAGERRLRAVKRLGQKEIPAVVKTEKELTRPEQALITATENLQREDLSPLELAKTYEMLMKTQNIDESQLAQNLHHTEQYVRNYLRLLSLGEKVKDALLDRKIGEGHARFLVGLSVHQQEVFLKIILDKDLTVKEVETLVRGEKIPEEDKKEVVFNVRTSNSHNISPILMKKVIKFTEMFPNAKLKTAGDDEKGKITISWDNTEK